jgi:peptide/nickel transport system substrate-binding protein
MRRLVVVLVAAAGIVLAACGSSSKSSSGSSTSASSAGSTAISSPGAGSSGSSSTTASAGTPKPGGTLTIIKGTEQPAGWDPIKFFPVPTNSPSLIDFAIYDSLFYENDNLDLVPRLGTSITTADNGLNWTLKLRPNVKFSDGTTFDAAAVQFNWQRIADPANKALTASVAQKIASMTVADPLTLNFVLKAPDLLFSHRIAQDLNWIASPTAVQKEGADFGQHPVGAGPFLFQSWVLNSQYTFVKNPNYWEAGRPYLDTLIVKVITDQVQAYNTFKTGGGNVLQVFDPAVISQATKDGYTVKQGSATGGGWSLGFNNSKPPFNNPLARKAIDLALNRDQFVQTRRDGNPAFALTTLDKKGTPFYDASITPTKYDSAQAQQLLDQYMQQTGQPLTFTLSVFSVPYLQQDGETLQAQIMQLKNVNVKLNPEPSPQLIQDFNSGNFEVYEAGARWNVPAIDMYNWFFSGSNLNYMRYNSPTTDGYLNQLLTIADTQSQVPVVHNAEKQILSDSGVAWYAVFGSGSIIDQATKNYIIYFDQQALLDSVWVQ